MTIFLLALIIILREKISKLRYDSSLSIENRLVEPLVARFSNLSTKAIIKYYVTPSDCR